MNNKSRLIHTAPVFEPNSVRASSAGGVKGSRGNGTGMGKSKTGYWARGAEQELERLDEAFLSVGDQVRAQKEAAQKWIRRQRIRMEVCGQSAKPCSVSNAKSPENTLLNTRYAYVVVA